MERVERVCLSQSHGIRSRLSLVGILFLVLALCGESKFLPSKILRTSDSTDVYERLETYGFPEGLLPHIVTGYTLEANGRFALYLENDCRVLIQDEYPLLYDKVITGYLSYGHLQGLKGITVKAFRFWWKITGISLGDDNSLYFEIGILSSKFPYSNFDDPPICEADSLDSAFMGYLSFE